MYFDSHAHFSADDGADALRGLLERARAAGVARILAVGGAPELNRGALAAAALAPGEVPVALGWDRDQATAESGAFAGAVAALARELEAAERAGVRMVAVGEIGLDLHYSPATAAAQAELLRAQLDFAEQAGLPVIIHSREADALTLKELERHALRRPEAAGRLGVLHCFTGGEDFARALVELGYHISFSGILTFRNADPLRAVARTIPAERLLIETDTPFLAPAPHRGRANEPALLPAVAARLAEVRGCPVREIAALTTANAERLFGLSR